MQRIIGRAGKDFKIQAEGSAWETGYGVYFEHDNGKRGSVQFGVHLTSSMQLISIPYRLHGSVSQNEFDIAKEIVSEELESNPSVFHILENGRTERDRLKHALKQAMEFNHVTSSDPEAIALEKRISDLSAIIKVSTAWAHEPSKAPYKQFLTDYRSSTFESSTSIPDTCPVHKSMGPYDLVSHVRKLEPEVGSIVVIPTGDALSRVPYAVAERRDYDWPLPWKFPDEETKWVHFHRLDFKQDRSERAKDILSRPDTLALVWTRRTDAAAFERIASVIGRDGNDPRLLIGSPEGTLSGRVSAIRLAMEAEPTLAPAI
ncbi:hypothetical protein [Rhizobium sp. MHM7A]|uniref:hypothetical protein n=1 Tax=Rhizobium sp. MHM7A TaxID=2583233 RepID=UPI001105F089|nr:hypothetical protein [Rhizobium sp. MHM7A]TLX17142.1 hypothetical protein FFR93_07475 [Rhizobium sp. MHM7A]